MSSVPMATAPYSKLRPPWDDTHPLWGDALQYVHVSHGTVGFSTAVQNYTVGRSGCVLQLAYPCKGLGEGGGREGGREGGRGEGGREGGGKGGGREGGRGEGGRGEGGREGGGKGGREGGREGGKEGGREEGRTSIPRKKFITDQVHINHMNCRCWISILNFLCLAER